MNRVATVDAHPPVQRRPVVGIDGPDLAVRRPTYIRSPSAFIQTLSERPGGSPSPWKVLPRCRVEEPRVLPPTPPKSPTRSSRPPTSRRTRAPEAVGPASPDAYRAPRTRRSRPTSAETRPRATRRLEPDGDTGHESPNRVPDPGDGTRAVELPARDRRCRGRRPRAPDVRRTDCSCRRTRAAGRRSARSARPVSRLRSSMWPNRSPQYTVPSCDGCRHPRARIVGGGHERLRPVDAALLRCRPRRSSRSPVVMTRVSETTAMETFDDSAGMGTVATTAAVSGSTTCSWSLDGAVHEASVGP